MSLGGGCGRVRGGSASGCTVAACEDCCEACGKADQGHDADRDGQLSAALALTLPPAAAPHLAGQQHLINGAVGRVHHRELAGRGLVVRGVRGGPEPVVAARSPPPSRSPPRHQTKMIHQRVFFIGIRVGGGGGRHGVHLDQIGRRTVQVVHVQRTAWAMKKGRVVFRELAINSFFCCSGREEEGGRGEGWEYVSTYLYAG